MKKIITLMYVLIIASSGAYSQTFYDDFDSYKAGDYLGPQSKDWTTWTFNDGGSDDILVDNTKPYSGKNSLHFVGQSGGGPHDVVLDFGGVHSKGRFKFSMRMYIPSKKSAYFNFQGGSTLSTWSMEFSFYTSNTYNLRNTSQGTLLNGSSYPVDQWFDMTIDADLDNDSWKLYFNNALQGTFTNSLNISYLDIYEEDANAEYWIDDVRYCVDNACNPELSIDKVVVTTNPICTFDSSDIAVTLTNHSTFEAPGFDLGIDVAGNVITKKINLNNLAGGKDTTFTIKNLFVSKVAGNSVTVKATNLSGDVEPKNDVATTTVKVNASPSEAKLLKDASFNTTRPSSTGEITDPDIITAGGNYTYEITPPKGYANGNYGLTWSIPTLSVKTASGVAINTSLYVFTAPSSAKGTILFKPDNSLIDSTIIISFVIADKTTGCDSVLSKYIYIAPVPDASFSVSNPCLGEKALFNNTSSILKGLITHQWYFGDGATSTDAQPEHAYSTAGTYDVKLVVTSVYDLKDSVTIKINVVPIPQASFTVTNSCQGDSIRLKDNSIYSGATPEYTWMFDDGSADINEKSGKIGKLYKAPGTYHVSMRISVNGCSNTISKMATYAPRAIPGFTFTVGNCDNADVTFTNTTPDIAFGTIGYTWKFGDNKTSNTENPLHTYNAFNTYNVTLITSSDLGCKDSVSKTVSLKESPKIGMSFSGPNCTNAGTSFNNTTTKPTGTTVSYVWDFGDGATATDEKPPHDYVAPGTYKVNLTATSSNGCNSTKEITVTINEKPTVKFISDKNNTCAGNEIQFNNQVSYSGTGLVYNWKFGNGQTSNLPDPTHTYTQAGSYKVTLVADVASCKDSASMTVDILAVPVSTFANVSEGLGLGGIVLTPDESNGAGTYRWIFGDNTADGSGKTSFTHRYPKVGYFKTCLVRKNGECESTSCENIVINAASVAKEMETVFNVYPNPSNGLFKIHFNTEVSKDVKVTVSNAIGEVISVYGYSGMDNGEMSIDMTNAASGVYLINIENNHTVSSKKITVVR